MKFRTIGISLIVLASLQGAPVFVPRAAAQSASIETITVTARKREERLIDVPVAATAFSGEAIQRYATADLSALSTQVPGVRFDYIPAGSGSALTIRGVGAAWFETSIDSSVVVDIDGVPVSRGRVMQQALLDMTSVNVLKGPQALYFGKNSPAGVVSMVSTNPSDKWEGKALMGYEAQDQEMYGEFEFGGPITDDLGVRVAIRGTDMFSGWITNMARPTADVFNPAIPLVPGAAHNTSPQSKTGAGRVSLVYTPTSQFDATLREFISHYSDNGNDQTEEISHCGIGMTQPAVFGVVDPFGDCVLNGKTSSGAEPVQRAAHYPMNLNGLPYSQFDANLTSLTMNYHLPDATFTSVTGFYAYLEYENDNYDMTVYDQLGGADREHYQSFTQEFRAKTSFDFPVNAMVGFFYQHENRNVHTSGAIFDAAFGVTADPSTGQTNNYMAHATNHGQTYSPFVELTWQVLDNLELEGGVRYTHEDKAGSTGYIFVNQTFGCPTCPFPLSPQGARLMGSLSENNLSPQGTITWHPTKEVMVYGAYKQGYKSGGFANPAILPLGIDPKSLIFKHERAEGYEFGSKASLLDGALTGDVTLFNFLYTNLQVTAFDAPTTSFTIQNAASARTRGVELNVNYRATEELSLRAEGAFIDAHYGNFPGAQCYAGQTVAQGCNPVTNAQNLAKRPLARDPNVTGSLGFSFDHPVTDALMVGLTSDIRFSSGYYMDATDPWYGYQKGYHTIDASLRFYPTDGPWEFAVIGRNLENTIYGMAGSSVPGGAPGQYGAVVPRLREIRLQASYKF